MNNQVDLAYEFFPVILADRLSYKRKTFIQPLAQFSSQLAIIIGLTNSDEKLMKLLNSKIDLLLQDCQITYNMSPTKAMDILLELSNLATIYALDPRCPQYRRICDLIKSIRLSYPPPAEVNEVF